VSLSLGGEANTTVLLSTLLQPPECRFTGLFRRQQSAPKDGEGRIFVDFQPALFVPLLEHLRMRVIEDPEDPTPPPDFESPALEAKFGKMLQHYGLKDWVYRPGLHSRSLEPSPPALVAATPPPAAAAAAAELVEPEPAEPEPPAAEPAEARAPPSVPVATPRRPSVGGTAPRPPASPSKPAAAVRERPSPDPAPTRQQPADEASAALHEVARLVAVAEAKVRLTLQAAAPLAAERAQKVGLQELRTASEQTLQAEKVAALACAEAKKALVSRQRDAKACQEAELSELSERLAAAQQELGKQRKVAVQGEKLWKSRLAFSEKGEELKQLEREAEALRGRLLQAGGRRPSAAETEATVSALQQKLTATSESLASSQQSGQVSSQSQLGQFLAQTKQIQKRLDGLQGVVKAQQDKAACDAILRDARTRREKLDAALQLLASAPEAAAERQALAGVAEKALAEARALATAMSSDIKGMTGVAAQAVTKELEALGRRIAEASEEVAKFKKDTEAHKRSSLQQEALKLVTAAEEAGKEASRAATPLCVEGGEAPTAEQAQEICEGVLQAEGKAAGLLEAARQFISSHLGVPELSKLVGRLNAVKKELAKAKAAASDYQHRVVARQVKQESAEMVGALEADFEKANEAAEPLLADRGRGLAVVTLAARAADALRAHATAAGISWEALFQRLGPGAAAGKASRAEFSDFLGQLPEPFSTEQSAMVFERADVDRDGSLSSADFLRLLRERCVCVKEIAITRTYEISVTELTTRSTLGKLLVGEAVEICAEPKRNSSTGITRVKIIVLKSATQGWITLKGNQGTQYLESVDPREALFADLEAALAGAQAAAVKAFEFVKAKSAELQDCVQGPLVEAKAEIAKVRPKVTVLQAKLDRLRKRVDETRREHARKEEELKKQRDEEKEKAAASVAVEEGTKDLEKVKKALEELRATAAPLTSTADQDLSSVARPLSVRTASKAAADGLSARATSARSRLAALEARPLGVAGGEAIAALRQQLEASEREAMTLMGKVQSAVCTLSAARLDRACVAFRGAMDARSLSAEQLFTEIAGSETRISEKAFFEHLERLEGVPLSSEQRQMLFQNISLGGGMSRRSFFSMLERYYKCVKDTVITSEFDIRKSEVLRKLDVGEHVELLEGPKADEALGVVRLRGRALCDGLVGWISAKGNKGTPYLQETPKPCFFATKEAVMEDDYSSDGCKPVRSLKPGEVIEVLEGPRKEAVGSSLRARGRAISDGATGWFTTRNKHGSDCVETGRTTYKCLAGIALTDAMDIKTSNPLRKLEAGEIVLLLEGPSEDAAAGVKRIRVQALKDLARGWITCKGSAGKIFAEESGQQTVVTRAVPLQAAFPSNSAPVRMLRELEFVEVLEGPREERSEAGVRVRGCAVSDGRIGWVTVCGGNLRPWSPSYRCVRPAPLHDSFFSSGTQPLRELEVGEMVELLEGPRLDASLGILRLKGRAEKDGTVGWATIADAECKPFLECIAAR